MSTDQPAQPGLEAPEGDLRDQRLLQVFLSGYAAGVAGEVARTGAPPAYAYPYGRHLAMHIVEDPIAVAQVLEGIRPLYLLGEVPPDAPTYITVHNNHGEGS